MKIKKFTAKNYKEALEMIKKEFGDDAVILSSEEKKGSHSYVEITSAIDYDNEFITKGSSEKVKSSFISSISGKFGHSHVASLYKNNKDENKKIEEHYSNLPPEHGSHKTTIEKAAPSVDKVREQLPPQKTEKKDLLGLLKKCSINEDYALNLSKKADSLDDIIYLMKHQLMVKDNSKNGKIIMLVGPTGVGKTTTIAKLSAKSLKEGKRVGIINLDTYRIGACEQIRIYARIMGIPLYIASSQDTVKDGISRFLRNRDVIFIDTMGKNPKDEEYNKFLANICLSDSNIELHLLISANSDDEFMQETYKFYKKLPVSCIAFTKVDEAVRFGSLYNLLMTYRKPVAYLTTGQKVPDDIEFPTLENLSELIVKKGQKTC